MTNFRQYVCANMKFSRTPGQLFTILRGNNGTGKTNIMNAITWCLYGSEKHLDNEQSALPIVNKKILKKTKKKIITMNVELGLIGEFGDMIKIGRELSLYRSDARYDGDRTGVKYDKDAGATIPVNYTPAVQKRYSWYDPNKGEGWKSTEYFDGNVMSLLPVGLSDYFLFDGEKLEDFFENIDNVKKGIEDVSQIEIMERAIKGLSDIISKKTRMSKKIDPQIKQHQEQVDNIRRRIKELIGEIKIHNTKLNIKQKRIHEIDTILHKSGGDASKFSTQAEVVKKEIKDEEKEFRNKESELKDYVLEHAAYVQSYSAIRKTLKIIKDKKSAGTLPPEIADTLLKKLLDNNCCICGNDISGGEPRDLVTKHLNRAQYTGIIEICTRLDYALEPQDTRLIDVQSGLREFEKNANKRKLKISELRERLGDLEAKLKQVGHVDIQKLAHERDSLASESTKLSVKIAYIDSDMQRANAELRKHETDLDKAYDEDKEHKRLTDELHFCRQSLSGLETTRKKLINDVRTEVQKYTKEYFLNFLWKKNTYVNVEISENYEVTAVDVDGFRVRENLSKGEKLILALAFMGALRRVTGFGFPLVIDTPLGRVSGETRHNIARTLPNFLQHEQIILLVTDSEYQAQIHDDEGQQVFPSVRETIASHVGIDYDIRFTDGSSEVKSHV